MIKSTYCLKKRPDAYLYKAIYDEAVNYSSQINVKLDNKLVSAKCKPEIFNLNNNCKSMIIYTDGIDEVFAMKNINNCIEKWCVCV